MIRGFLSLYWWRYPEALVYMLQSTEYQLRPYLVWYWQTTDFTRVARRRTLDRTKAARLLLLGLRVGIGLQLLLGLALLALWHWRDWAGAGELGLALLLSYPLVWAHAVTLPLALGRWLIVQPRHKKAIAQSEQIFKAHEGAIVAIAGSYGKTSMKELLLTILGEGLAVAATPANKNVAISHAAFARRLTGNEAVLLIEYGEGEPGDVAAFSRTTHPTHAIITGIAPAHLDHYASTEDAARDIFSVTASVQSDQVFVNAESPLAKAFIADTFHTYSHQGALGWKVKDVVLDVTGTRFTLTKGTRRLALHTRLIGRHQIGPLTMAVALADSLGLSEAHIRAGVAKTTPYEHRMQPYNLHGAWIIDDTYNGNIEGIRAGTALLAELPATRKIYVTPGLVDQGAETKAVHQAMGGLIAMAGPDIVVLMRNSVTPYIQEGLEAGNYQGQTMIVDDPLRFYTSLDAFVATGDLVVLQNDWTDNYH